MKHDYIDREAFEKDTRERFCKGCDRRRGMKNGKYRILYQIGEAPCRSCWIEDALDLLEFFPAADVPESPQWISVKDRLPDYGNFVLVTNGKTVKISNIVGTVTYNANGEMEELTMDWNGLPFYPDNVTHWMPIPEVPEDGES